MTNQFRPTELLFSIKHDYSMDMEVVYICPLNYFKQNGGLFYEISEDSCGLAFSMLEKYGIYLYELLEGMFELSYSSKMPLEEVKNCFVECGFVSDEKFDELIK